MELLAHTRVGLAAALAAVAVLLGAVVVARGHPAEATTPAVEAAPSGQGASAVFRLIARTNDCRKLRRDLTVASNQHEQAPSEALSRWTSDYMRAARERAQAVGCLE